MKPRSMRRNLRGAIVLLAIVRLAACGADSTAPPDLGPLFFNVTIGCAPLPTPPYQCTPSTNAFSRGELMIIGEQLVDTTATQATAQVTVRAICWQNLEILRGGLLVDYLPRVSTCPDSTMSQGENAPRVLILRIFQFAVPDVWTPGTYTVRSLMLVDPPVTVSRTFTIR